MALGTPTSAAGGADNADDCMPGGTDWTVQFEIVSVGPVVFDPTELVKPR